MSGGSTFIGRNRRSVTIGVIVAAIVLIGVAVVLVAGLLSSRDGVADASASPSPSASPSTPPSGEPSPSGAPSLPSPTPAVPVVESDQPFAAIVLVNDLQVREAPVDGTALGAVSEGDVVMMTGFSEEHDGAAWYNVEAPGGTYGWVSGGPADDPYLDVRYPLARRIPPQILGMAGGHGGVIAWGVGERVSTEASTSTVVVLSDGGRWTAYPGPFDPAAQSVVTAAFGPAGWVMAASDETNEGLGGAWRSADGITWEELDIALPERVVPRTLAGSASGYALEARDDRSGTSRSAVFLSRDGSAWEAVDVPVEVGELRLTTVEDGILAYASDTPDASLFLHYSPDASSWVDLAQGSSSVPTGSMALVGAARDRLVAVTFEGIESELRVWTAPSPASGATSLAWTRQASAEAALAGMAIGRLVSVGDRLVATGQAIDDGALVVWRTADGTTWEAIDATAIQGPGLLQAAATGSQLATVGSEMTDAGLNPRFWLSAAGDGWAEETDPALGTVESAVVGACPASPTSMLEWMAIPDVVGAECFEDAPVTFPAWLTNAGGCGGFTPGRYEPAWLAGHFSEGGIILEPMESPDGGCGSAATSPGLEIPPVLQWVDVTGHWADPASSTCRYLPDPAFAGTSGTEDLTFSCRLRFVATALEPTDAP